MAVSTVCQRVHDHYVPRVCNISSGLVWQLVILCSSWVVKLQAHAYHCALPFLMPLWLRMARHRISLLACILASCTLGTDNHAPLSSVVSIAHLQDHSRLAFLFHSSDFSCLRIISHATMLLITLASLYIHRHSLLLLFWILFLYIKYLCNIIVFFCGRRVGGSLAGLPAFVQWVKGLV